MRFTLPFTLSPLKTLRPWPRGYPAFWPGLTGAIALVGLFGLWVGACQRVTEGESLTLPGILRATSLGESNPLERRSLDLRFRLRGAPASPSPVTALVLRSQSERRPEQSLREELASALELLATSQAAPAAVVVDVLLSQEDSPSLHHRPSAGERIIQSTEKLERVVHPIALSFGAEPYDATPPLQSLRPHFFDLALPLPERVAFRLRAAHPSLAQQLYAGARAVGHTNLPPMGKPGRATAYAIPLIERLEAHGEPLQVLSLALAGALVARSTQSDALQPRLEAFLQEEASSLPLTREGDLPINFRPRFEMKRDLLPSPLEGKTDVLFFEPGSSPSLPGRLRYPNGTEVSSPERILLGQVVLIVDALEPRLASTPLGPLPLWTVHAQAMANLLEADYLRPLLQSTSLILGLLLCMLSALLLRPQVGSRPEGLELRGLELRGSELRGSELRGLEQIGVALRRVPLEVMVGATYLGLSLLAFMAWSRWLPWVTPCVMLAGQVVGRALLLPEKVRSAVHRVAQLQQEALELATAREVLTQERSALVTQLAEASERAAVALMDVAQSGEALEAAIDSENEAQALAGYCIELAATLAERPPLESVSGLKGSLSELDERIQAVTSREAALEQRLNSLRDHYTGERRWLSDRVKADESSLNRLQGELRRLRRQLETLKPAEVMGQRDLALEKSTGYVTQDRGLIRELRRLLEQVAPTDMPVLLLGETGTGKDVIAQAIHRKSGRARNMVVVNCAAFPQGDTLISELFGHVKGAFTGASSDREGLFVEADHSTLFLDELGKVPLEIQNRLLRVIETGEVVPLGAGQRSMRKTHFRIIAAMKEDPTELMAQGLFAEDLFYRLCGKPFQIPPLRQRAPDILLLANYFLELEARRAGRNPVPCLEPEALSLLLAHPFRGNVRELKSLVGRLMLFDGPIIGAAQVQAELTPLTRDPGPNQAPGDRSREGKSRRTSATQAPSVSPDALNNTRSLSIPLGAKEQGMLKDLRRWAFDVSRYTTSRNISVASGYNHLHILFGHAILEANGSLEGGAEWLVGKRAPALEAQVRGQMATFFTNLKGRASWKEDPAKFEADIRKQYSAKAEVILEGLRQYLRQPPQTGEVRVQEFQGAGTAEL